MDRPKLELRRVYVLANMNNNLRTFSPKQPLSQGNSKTNKLVPKLRTIIP